MGSRSKPFKCSDCSKRFTTENGLANHMKNPGKRHQTDQTRSERRRALSKRMNSSRSKPFQCSVCSKRFTKKNGRGCHEIAVHSLHGDKLVNGAFTCPFCSRTCRRIFDLLNHLENPGKRHQRGGVTVENLSARHELDVEDFREKSSLDLHFLNKFISDELQPDEDFNHLCSEAIDSLYKVLQRDFSAPEYTDYGIHNLIKGGSIAKGTAIKNNSDLDCVMVMNSIENASQLRGKLPAILDKLELHLGSSIWVKGELWLLTSMKNTQFSLQFNMSRYSHPEESVKVDLLPTFEASVEDIAEREKFYREMRDDEDNWKFYSAALVKKQVEFVKKQPANVKDLIRLVKYWRKKYIPQSPGARLPPSYLLELLTIHAWEKANCPERFDMKIGFKAVMEVLRDHQSLLVSWEDNYEKDLIKCSLQRPHVIDPANPTNNMYEPDTVNCWDEVRKVAEQTMKKPLFRGVEVTANWR